MYNNGISETVKNLLRTGACFPHRTMTLWAAQDLGFSAIIISVSTDNDNYYYVISASTDVGSIVWTYYYYTVTYHIL